MRRNNYKHGMSASKLYGIWDAMKSRCYRKGYHGFRNYGGRGITVCEAWKQDFVVFQEWATANGYRDGLSLDRIDNDGNYCPENCRWVTMKEQENNKRNNVRIEYKGEVHTIPEWSEIVGVSIYALYHRIHRGWSIERALTTKERVYQKKGSED